jgi:hypothetical protein
VRANASVAGVVTLMLLREGSDDRVAILFTADTVRPAAERFIRRPQRVLSTCGLGPDYIPPVPKTYEIPEPPPTAEPVRITAPPATPRPPPATATPTREPQATYPRWTPPPPPPCPEGSANAHVDEVAATEKPEEPGTWVVRVKGRVTNDGSGEIYIERITVRIEGETPFEGEAEPDRRTLEPQGAAGWELADAEVRSAEAPTQETTTATLEWRWTGEAISCPTG